MFKRKKGTDVSGALIVCDMKDIKNEICSIFKEIYPNNSVQPIENAFDIYDKLYTGDFKQYLPCDMLYHDREHVQEVTLATARLLYGLSRVKDPVFSLIVDVDYNHAICAIIIALFHDSGYLRLDIESDVPNGAIFTKTHVARSADVLYWVMNSLKLKKYTRVVTEAVHYTGYEKNIKFLDLQNKQEKTVGCLVGTADMIGQMSDRCYLEKCYYRLFPEFVLGGLFIHKEEVIYSSPDELMSKTFDFFNNVVRSRLELDLGGAYHLADGIFPAQQVNLYIWYIEQNLKLLKHLIGKKLSMSDVLNRELSNTDAAKHFPYDLVQQRLKESMTKMPSS